MRRCLVFDLGAGSGRAMLATADGRRLTLGEIHRFDGYAVMTAGEPRWDVARLLACIEEGLWKAQRLGVSIDSIGVDSWGLDYVLYGASGERLGAAHHYRHPRSQRGHDAIPLTAAQLFAENGAQDLPVNTVFQLYDEARHHPDRHAAASRLLMMADVVNHHLTGAFRSEVTLARTSGLLQLGADDWNRPLCERLGIPARLLQPLIGAGETYGVLRSDLAQPLGWGSIPIIAVRAHDTASAVGALGSGAGSAFLICGSWSLIGIERPPACAPADLLQTGYGIEGDVKGRPFLVRSLNGLNLLRLLRESWQRRTGELVAFAAITLQAVECPDPDKVPAIDPSDPVFFNPADFIDAAAAFYARNRQDAPRELGALARAIYAGLAGEVANALHSLERLLGAPVPGLRLCGGGAQDTLLCRLIADLTGKRLRIGPIEASAWGNALVQFVALGAIASLEDGQRRIEHTAVILDPA